MQADHDHWPRVPRLADSATPAEQFSIWAMRLWWGAFPELDAAWKDLLHGFRVCGVAAAIESCHRFCSVVLSAAGCGQGVACVHCPRITPLEERLLEAFAVASTQDPSEAETLLRQVMPASAARLAAPHAARLARALAQAGLQWPAPADTRFVSFDTPPPTNFSQRLH